MLTEPITQSDVDEGTVFLGEDGETTTVTKETLNPDYPWRTTNGRLYSAEGLRYYGIKSGTDLICRLPKPQGEKMESQVTIKDKRTISAKRVHSFGSFEHGTILSPAAHPESIWMKTGEATAIEIIGAKPGKFQPASPVCECFAHPDLCLDLILRNA